MGSRSYDVYVEGSNPLTCFDKAVQDAQHESGHGGYTGTIGEKQGEGFSRVETGPLPLAAARELANTLCNADEDEGSLVFTDKWGPANAIPVAPDSAFRTKQKTLYLSVQEEGHLEPVRLAQERMRNSTIAKVEVLEDKRRTKLERTRAKKRTTVWSVTDQRGSTHAYEDSASAACKEAERLAKANPTSRFFVNGRICGEGRVAGVKMTEFKDYASYSSKQVSRKVKLKVTYVEPTRRDPAPVGWLFFGYASC